MSSTKLAVSPPSAPPDALALTKATLRAAKILKLDAQALAAVLGLSDTEVAGIQAGESVLQRGQQEFHRAALFVRAFRSLDAIVDGDDHVAQNWIVNLNTALGDAPLNLIKKDTDGLLHVIHYLDACRARV